MAACATPSGSVKCSSADFQLPRVYSTFHGPKNWETVRVNGCLKNRQGNQEFWREDIGTE